MASWLIRMVLSSGKSTTRRRAICSGLHALAHRRSFRWPCRRPFHGTAGPGTKMPFAAATSPASLSSTYMRRAGFSASLANFGRRPDRSACHCAVEARYSKPHHASRRCAATREISLRPIGRGDGQSPGWNNPARGAERSLLAPRRRDIVRKAARPTRTFSPLSQPSSKPSEHQRRLE